ncbi:hypothetical protein AAMO2058_000929300 [Amorphochlora amoebiformis]
MSIMRFELFFKSALELRRQVPFLKKSGIYRVNLPNKGKQNPMADWCAQLKEVYPDVDICPHYSLKYQYYGSPEKTFAHFEKFCAALPTIGIQQCLLISGGGKKRKSDLSTLACLQMAQRRRNSSIHKIEIGSAFNPYFPKAEQRAEERKTLKLKLSTGLVSSVWIQIGSDDKLLREGLTFIKDIEKKHTDMKLEIYGSVFLPSERLLNQMRFRPWNGVFLSEKYLSDIESANEITLNMLKTYAEFDVTVLCETSIRGDIDIRRFQNFLQPYNNNMVSKPSTDTCKLNAGACINTSDNSPSVNTYMYVESESKKE